MDSRGGRRPDGLAWKAGIAGGLVALAAGGAAMQLLGAPDPPLVKAVPPADTRKAPDWIAEFDAAHAGPIRADASGYSADIVDEPIAQAIAQLADATHSGVTGQELMRDPRPLTMHWQARDAFTAWRMLLGARAQYGIECKPAGCQVAIHAQLDPSAPSVPATQPVVKPATKSERPDPDTSSSQPDGAC